MKTKEIKDKNIHSGNQTHMREQINKLGLYTMSDVNFLEYLLSFVKNRADTHQIAHALLNEFGSISNVFNASNYALMQVNGVDKQTAMLLQYMSVVVFMNNKAIAKSIHKLDSLETRVKYIENILPPVENEQFIVIVVNKNYKIKAIKAFKGVSHSFISIDKNELAEFLINFKGEMIILAHTHPNHSASPSLSDIETFETLQKVFDSLSMNIIDNLIIGNNNVYSFITKEIHEKNINDLF